MTAPAGSLHATILIAEDHADSRDALQAILESAGYEVRLAHNGREAVERAEEVRPDLIVMDIMMPEVDGFEATRRLRGRPGFENTPIIALTAMEGSRALTLAAGCNDHVLKPVNIRTFLEKVRDWLEAGGNHSN
ncbi:MAG: response regulator [Longimicrobiaceae bacterium]